MKNSRSRTGEPTSEGAFSRSRAAVGGRSRLRRRQPSQGGCGASRGVVSGNGVRWRPGAVATKRQGHEATGRRGDVAPGPSGPMATRRHGEMVPGARVEAKWRCRRGEQAGNSGGKEREEMGAPGRSFFQFRTGPGAPVRARLARKERRNQAGEGASEAGQSPAKGQARQRAGLAWLRCGGVRDERTARTRSTDSCRSRLRAGVSSTSTERSA